MSDNTIRTAILAPSALGGLAVVCIGILIAVLNIPDVAALAVLPSIASAAVGDVAGTVNSSRTQPQDQSSSTKKNSDSTRNKDDEKNRAADQIARNV